jgi:DNA-binding NtrC family response regulator
MTRVLVVHPDRAVAEQMADDLRRAGYDIEHCDGPAEEPCPIVGGLPCPLVDRSDVLVYDAWAAGDSAGGQHLISELREAYVDLPVVLTSADSGVPWVELAGPRRVIPLGARPAKRELVDAIESALDEQGMAV